MRPAKLEPSASSCTSLSVLTPSFLIVSICCLMILVAGYIRPGPFFEPSRLTKAQPARAVTASAQAASIITQRPGGPGGRELEIRNVVSYPESRYLFKLIMNAVRARTGLPGPGPGTGSRNHQGVPVTSRSIMTRPKTRSLSHRRRWRPLSRVTPAADKPGPSPGLRVSRSMRV